MILLLLSEMKIFSVKEVHVQNSKKRRLESWFSGREQTSPALVEDHSSVYSIIKRSQSAELQLQGNLTPLASAGT